MRIHELKTWPEPFQAMSSGDKQFECRKDDRGFAVGDLLKLREWDPGIGHEGYTSPWKRYTGRVLWRRVTYILHGGRFGLTPDLVVMSVAPSTDPSGEEG